jgi:hypothetical protein
LIFPVQSPVGGALALNPEVLHLHTYFFFPISIDQAARKKA